MLVVAIRACGLITFESGGMDGRNSGNWQVSWSQIICSALLARIILLAITERPLILFSSLMKSIEIQLAAYSIHLVGKCVSMLI